LPERIQRDNVRSALACALLLAAGSARAESDLALPIPDPLGTFRGVIHDHDGAAIGVNVVQNLLREDGRVYLRSEASVAAEPGNLLEAELEPIPGSDRLLRPVWQRTRMPARGGGELIDLFVDHRSHRATCDRNGERVQEIALGGDERIANVTMNLALKPLAAGALEAVRFQLVLCEGWKSIVDVEARADGNLAGEPVEMRLRFDVGSRALSMLLERFLPDIRVWMRPQPPNEWIAHRLPLYPDGPTIAIVREGIEPTAYLPGSGW